MIILGLTGSIGMGKSTASRFLRYLGVPVYDADGAVHHLIGRRGAAVAAIESVFPGVTRDGAIDRGRLGACVFGDRPALARLEGILHPLIQAEERRFVQRARRQRLRFIALDVPLLFEAKTRVDYTVVLTCPAFLQEQRVLRRPGMTREKLGAIRRRQMPDSEKRRLADAVVFTGIGRRHTLRQLSAVVRLLAARFPSRRR